MNTKYISAYYINSYTVVQTHIPHRVYKFTPSLSGINFLFLIVLPNLEHESKFVARGVLVRDELRTSFQFSIANCSELYQYIYIVYITKEH